MRKLLSLLLVLALAFTLAAPAAMAEPDPDSVKTPIVEVQANGQAEVDALISAGLDVLKLDVDGDICTLTIMAHEYELDYFAANEIEYTVVIEDSTVEVEWLGYQKSTARAAAEPIEGLPGTSGTGRPGLTVEPDTVFDPTNVLFNDKYGFPSRLGYRTVSELYGEINYLAQEYPDIVKLHVLGKSWDGNPLVALEVCNAPGVHDGRPESMHVAGHHAREWPSNEYCMNLAWYLITQYGTNSKITDLLDTTRVWLMPVVNPDGTHWDQTHSPGNWRKNRNPNNGATGNSVGIDLNRNYAYDWGSNTGSSGTMSQETYRGATPFSEPETRAVRDILTNNQVMTTISGHTWGELIQYAWSYRDNNPGHPNLEKHGRDMADICLYAEQVNNAMYDANGGLDDYAFAATGTLCYTFEHGSFGFIRPYMGEANYGTYGALAPYNDYYGNQRRIPLTYPTATQVAAAGAPKADITAEVVIITEPFIPGSSVGNSSYYSTVAKVQAVADQLEGKILMMHRASSNANNAAVVKAAQDAGAVGVIMCANTTGDQNEYYVPNIGTTGDALLINIPVGGSIRMTLREYFEHVQKGGKNELTLTSYPEPGGGSIYYHWERLVGAFLFNIEAAHNYASHLKGSITDGAGAPIASAALDLSIDVSSRVRQSNGNLLPDDTYVDTRTSHMDAAGGTFDWAVTPSAQPHYDNAGYAVTASANGAYSQTKTVHVNDFSIVADNVNFTLPTAISSNFDFGKAWGPVGTVTVPFSTHSADGSVGVIDGAAVTATVGGLPVTVNSLGGGNYTA
ncbi:MAG: M14 family metallopeptidase, partial [Clostridiales bacterium]|nr:M14 family metallopeptidase [Clostridiales bacterium]